VAFFTCEITNPRDAQSFVGRMLSLFPDNTYLIKFMSPECVYTTNLFHNLLCILTRQGRRGVAGLSRSFLYIITLKGIWIISIISESFSQTDIKLATLFLPCHPLRHAEVADDHFDLGGGEGAVAFFPVFNGEGGVEG